MTDDLGLRDGEEAFTRQRKQNTQMGSVFHVAGVGLENGEWGCRCVWSAGLPHTFDARRAGLGFVLQAVGTLGGSEQGGAGCLDILEGYSSNSEQNALQGEAGGREVGKRLL